MRYLLLLTPLMLATACASAEPTGSASVPKRPPYRPGQSLTARLCECKECFDRACCGGEPSDAEQAASGELGMSVSACGRCVRRTWTVRGNDSCASHAPDTCCSGSASE